MKLDFGDYLIVTDEIQFIVQARKFTQAGNMTKPGNEGKEKLVNVAYCSTFKGALNYLEKQILLDNDDLTLILVKLDELEAKTKQFIAILRQGDEE